MKVISKLFVKFYNGLIALILCKQLIYQKKMRFTEEEHSVVCGVKLFTNLDIWYEKKRFNYKVRRKIKILKTFTNRMKPEFHIKKIYLTWIHNS